MMNQFLSNIPGYTDAVGKLPSGEVEIDEKFIETHLEALDELKAIFEPKGGIHVLSREHDETEKSYSVIVRVPSKINQEKAMKALSEKKRTSLDIQTSMLLENLLYPSPEVVRQWLEEKPGLPVAYANDLTELAGTTATVIRKKL
jgi:hypothetical protein